jgi:hypothetical protein
VLYVAVSLVVTGMVKYTDIKVDAPLAEAFRSVGKPGFATVISLGALVGLTTVMMILMRSEPGLLRDEPGPVTARGFREGQPDTIYGLNAAAIVG